MGVVQFRVRAEVHQVQRNTLGRGKKRLGIRSVRQSIFCRQVTCLAPGPFMRTIHLIAAVALYCSTSALSAQSPLTTEFTGTSSIGLGSAAYFDLAVGTVGLSVSSFDLSLTGTVGTAAGLEVWIRTGSHVGAEQSPVGWSRVARDNGVSVAAGAGMPSQIRLQIPFCLEANTLTGIALISVGDLGHRYSSSPSSLTFGNADLALNAGAVQSKPFSSVAVASRLWNGSINYVPAPGCRTSFPASLIGTAEPVLNTTTMDDQRSHKHFENNWFLRWNVVDVSGTTANNLVIVSANFGSGPLPIGNTQLLPGFEQLWAGSTPAGVAVIVAPGIVGGQPVVVPVPPNVLQVGDRLRLQGIMMDPSIGGPIPALPTNTIEFEHRDPANVEVRCDGTNSFNSVTTSGFFSINHLPSSSFPPIESVTFDWLTSPNPAQFSMLFDTDQVRMGDLFEGGNGGAAGCLGTYRNMSHITTGLVFDGANTVPGTPCDPTANTGWIGTNPRGLVGGWQTLTFRFTSFNPGTMFEFDADTDGGLGSTGADMVGMVVTIHFVGGTSLTNEIIAAGPNLGIATF